MPSQSRLKIALVGCGNMGHAMLSGWLKSGILDHAHIVDPHYNHENTDQPVTVCRSPSQLPSDLNLIVFAVKPQIISKILDEYSPNMDNAAAVSVAAGTPVSTFEEILGSSARIIRTMPNTPSQIGKGITGLFANQNCSDDDRKNTDRLLGTLGPTVWCKREDQLNDITALSGSGPAYVFHMIEAMAEAGCSLGLSEKDAMKLARQTVIGAAALAEQNAETTAEDLRRNVTSPNGTTQAGLEVLMNQKEGLPPLMQRVLAAAAKRARELSKE